MIQIIKITSVQRQLMDGGKFRLSKHEDGWTVQGPNGYSHSRLEWKSAVRCGLLMAIARNYIPPVPNDWAKRLLEW